MKKNSEFKAIYISNLWINSWNCDNKGLSRKTVVIGQKFSRQKFTVVSWFFERLWRYCPRDLSQLCMMDWKNSDNECDDNGEGNMKMGGNFDNKEDRFSSEVSNLFPIYDFCRILRKLQQDWRIFCGGKVIMV